MIEDIVRKKVGPKISIKQGVVEMIHGAGGKAMHQLIEQLFLAEFSNDYLLARNDQASFFAPEGRFVFSTDSHVVSPLFFPGGDIGSLSVYGTINDIAMGGAKPLYLSAGFILEEGFPLVDLKKIVKSMAKAAVETETLIVTGDTKVVEKGKGDGVFITTSGIGLIPKGVTIENNIQPGDQVILSGFIAEHGMAILSKRENLDFNTPIASDSCALHDLTLKITEIAPSIKAFRDPTRGGVAGVLNEWAEQHRVGFFIDEKNIPIREPVLAACELLGIDPLYVANEGKLMVVCAKEIAPKVLNVMRQHPKGRHSAVMGEVIHDPHHFVQMRTRFGGQRIVDWLSGDQLPRIC